MSSAVQRDTGSWRAAGGGIAAGRPCPGATADLVESFGQDDRSSRHVVGRIADPDLDAAVAGERELPVVMLPRPGVLRLLDDDERVAGHDGYRAMAPVRLVLPAGPRSSPSILASSSVT